MSEEIEKLIEAARKLDAVCEKREQRTKQILELAAEARRTGEPQTHRLKELPEVMDIGNEVAEIREAVRRIR